MRSRLRTLVVFIFAALAGGIAPRAAAQADGSSRWAGPFVTAGYIVSSPAVAADGTIYIGSQDRHLYAIAPSGALKWRFLTGDWVDATPAIGADGTIYVGSWDGKLYALTPAGAKKWDYSTGAGNYIYSSPAIGADGTIYCGAGDGNLHALRPDGTLKWTYPAGDWIDSSPAIGANGLIYYGSWDGFIYALRDEGEGAREVWRHATNGPVLASPAIGRDGTIYIGANDGRLYALDGETGARRWDFNLGGTVEASPAVGPDGTIYAGSGAGRLVALSPGGVPRWSFPTAEPIISTPAVRADGTVFFGSGTGSFYALNAEGALRWRIGTGDWVDSSPVLARDGTIYVGSYDRKIYALNGNGAPASSLSPWPMFRREPLRAARVPEAAVPGRLAGLATRARVGGGFNLIAGFAVAGHAPQPLLIRAVGPTLAAFGVPVPLADPQLELHAAVDGVDTVLARNDDWGTASNAREVAAAAAATGAFALPAESLDAALVLPVAPRGHSVVVGRRAGESGLALVEIYDADLARDSARLFGLSARGSVGTGGDILTLGFVIAGPGPARLLLRGIGPALTAFGVPGALARPVLTLYRGAVPLASNGGWSVALDSADLSGAATTVGAFALDRASADTALLATLPPGAYTLQISGVGGTTGEALGEIYVVP